jgi:hypothetical protein
MRGDKLRSLHPVGFAGKNPGKISLDKREAHQFFSVSFPHRPNVDLRSGPGELEPLPGSAHYRNVPACAHPNPSAVTDQNL